MHDNTALTCPYYRHMQGGPRGSCHAGCWEEPACITEEPSSGWRPRGDDGRFITRAAFEATLTGGAS